MNKDLVQAAIDAAADFIKAAKAARADIEEGGSGTKLTGACRRASMELTRALAEMRKP